MVKYLQRISKENLKLKLKQYSVFLKNAVTENDKLKTRLTNSIDSEKLNDENNELFKKLKSAKESVREKNKEIAKLKTDKIDLSKALSKFKEDLSIAQNKFNKLEVDKTYRTEQTEGYK